MRTFTAMSFPHSSTHHQTTSVNSVVPQACENPLADYTAASLSEYAPGQTSKSSSLPRIQTFLMDSDPSNANLYATQT